MSDGIFFNTKLNLKSSTCFVLDWIILFHKSLWLMWSLQALSTTLDLIRSSLFNCWKICSAISGNLAINILSMTRFLKYLRFFGRKTSEICKVTRVTSKYFVDNFIENKKLNSETFELAITKPYYCQPDLNAVEISRFFFPSWQQQIKLPDIDKIIQKIMKTTGFLYEKWRFPEIIWWY